MTEHDSPFFAGTDRREALAALRAIALARGVTAEEFDEAASEDRLDLLVVDRLLVAGASAKTGREVSDSSGMEFEQADRLWRALGFPEAGEAAVFNEQDVDALRTIRGLAELGLSSPETSVQLARVLGQSMSRLADAFVGTEEAVVGPYCPAWAATPEDDALVLATAMAFVSEMVLPSMEKLLVYAWRRHVQAAAGRRVSLHRGGTNADRFAAAMTVGFADMVGFTALSSQLSVDELVAVVDRFEELAHTTVVDGGARPVKMIGDEVMFVTPDAACAVEIGLALVDAYADDDLLSDVRVGLARGEVLMREGDFFGSSVNRAHRIVSIADPGTLLVDEAMHEALEAGEDGLVWDALAPRELKDIGRAALWRVRRPGRDESDDRRSGRRWRRFSGIRPALQALRHSDAG